LNLLIDFLAEEGVRRVRDTIVLIGIAYPSHPFFREEVDEGSQPVTHPVQGLPVTSSNVRTVVAIAGAALHRTVSSGLMYPGDIRLEQGGFGLGGIGEGHASAFRTDKVSNQSIAIGD
jgi:hypothetical protein